MNSRIKLAKLSHWLHLMQPLFLLLPILIIKDVVRADNLTQRSITINTPTPSAETTHKFRFSISTPATLGSILIQYCSNDPFFNTPCTPPTGLSLADADLSAQTGETGFSIDPSSDASNLILTRTPALSSLGEVTYTFDNIINPSTSGITTYVRISTYSSSDASGTRTDQGAVAFTTSGSFAVGGFVPPFLNFCVGITVAGDCSSFSGELGNLGELGPSRTASLNSQFAASTNDVNGYLIYSLGTTLTSGNNVIPAASAPTAIGPGRSKFGLNLRKNTFPSIGADVNGNGTGLPLSDYNSPNLFMFEPGDPIAGSTKSTDYSLFTVSYITDVSADQPAGVYTTTITYLAAVQF